MEERSKPSDVEPWRIAKIIERYFPTKEVDPASISQLPSYEDRNYVFDATIGDPPTPGKYLLKVSNTYYTSNQDIVWATHGVMRHVAERGIPCPLPLPSTSGDDFVIVNEGQLTGEHVASSRKHIVRVFNYLPGVPLSEIDLCPQLLYRVGEIAGKLDCALMSFHHSTLQRRGREFDLERLSDLRTMVPVIKDPKHCMITERVLHMFEDHVMSCLPQLTYGVIHSDLHDLNILAQRTNGSYEVSGVLDFADCYYSHYVYELGTLMAELMPKRKDPVQWVCPLVAGYQQNFPLNPTEMDCLYYIVLARLCLSATLCYDAYQREPSNTYLLTGVDGFWELAEELLCIPKDVVGNIWRKAAMDTSYSGK